jgi:hypothetical protein
MRCGAFILALLLVACSDADEQAPDTPPTGAVAAAPAPAPAPIPAIEPVDCGDERNGGYGNAKVCYYDQCNKGDAEACRMAETYNGNLYPSYLLDTVDCGDGSGTGPRHSKSCWIEACRQGIREACDIATSERPLRAIFGVADTAPRLEEMNYLDARKVIIRLGWQPLDGNCDAISQATCIDFPEIGNCSGTGLGFCDMHFRRGKRCLTIVTTGDTPDRAQPDRTSVEWVRFTKAPCAKDPGER